MAIEFDCSMGGLVVIIQGVTCNCNSNNHKQTICDTIRQMNSDESICIERRQMNNPNLPPYDWGITPANGGLSIEKGGNVVVNIYANPQNLPLINAIFQQQIDKGIAWCKANVL
jgi:hypothetical protein